MQDADKATKQTITQAYESNHFNEVLAETLHLGGLELTARVAEIAGINENLHVLDIASGRGTTACFLARQYGCRVTGIDLSDISTKLSTHKATVQGLAPDTGFLTADAEYLPFADCSFDVIVSECSFSLLTNKEIGAQEIARVLKPGGTFAFTDVLLTFPLSQDLKTNLTFSCCFSGAETKAGYLELLEHAGLAQTYFEDHSKTLKKATYQVITGYGSLSAFWDQFGSKADSCCPVSGDTSGSRKLWLRMFREGKPGYGLFSFIKP
ncbi:MAG: class I SAM-dependent methyltransferase [Chloroflexi bacterium]|nr:class I SAM-dependent methyltransferase [Chloroflexota bacterium]